MPDILHELPIQADRARVFAAVSTPAGLDTWWTLHASGTPQPGADYALNFGPEYAWRARVTACVPDRSFALELTAADADWLGTRVSFELERRDAATWLRFAHTGWPSTNQHYRISCTCWAMYLRILRRSLEHGESVPYAQRLDV